jgi:hypothetical protein
MKHNTDALIDFNAEQLARTEKDSTPARAAATILS